MHGLIIKEPWIDQILKNEKDWEIRGTDTRIRGCIALIKSGTGMIFGTVEIIDTKRLSLQEFILNEKHHRIKVCLNSKLPYSSTYAWVLSKPILFKSPMQYTHPPGAIRWVKLKEFNVN